MRSADGSGPATGRPLWRRAPQAPLFVPILAWRSAGRRHVPAATRPPLRHGATCVPLRRLRGHLLRLKVSDEQDAPPTAVKEATSLASDADGVDASAVADQNAKLESRDKHLRELLAWLGVFGVATVVTYAVDGGPRTSELIAGYAVEQALSVDNLFVFLLIFRYFGVTQHAQRRVLRWGIATAAVLRGAMIIAGESLLARFSVLEVVLGGVLVYSAASLLQSALSGEGDQEAKEDLSNNRIVRLSRFLLRGRATETYDGNRFFTEGRTSPEMPLQRLATPLLVCLISVELSDVVFALDSVPAVLAISRDAKVVYVSNLLAICTLRSVFFLLEDAIGSLKYLPHSLSAVLGFIGAKLCASYWGVTVDTAVSLGVVLACLGLGVGASVLDQRAQAQV